MLIVHTMAKNSITVDIIIDYAVRMSPIIDSVKCVATHAPPIGIFDFVGFVPRLPIASSQYSPLAGNLAHLLWWPSLSAD